MNFPRQSGIDLALYARVILKSFSNSTDLPIFKQDTDIIIAFKC